VSPRLIPFPEFLLRGIAHIGDALSGRTFLPTTRQVEQLLGSLVVDSSLIETSTAFRHRFSLAEGMKTTADWYLAAAQ
jgi:nucleoside-diphosphate-sugar epimerase